MLLSTQPCTIFFFFNDTATTEIYTLSLHDALPISIRVEIEDGGKSLIRVSDDGAGMGRAEDRKSTRLNSSHSQISYAVFCLKKKKNNHMPTKNQEEIACQVGDSRRRWAANRD